MTLVHSDKHRRVSLEKVLEPDRDYRVSVSPHGTVTLEPVTIISDYERSLLSNPVMAAALETAINKVHHGHVTTVHQRQKRYPKKPTNGGKTR